MKPYTKPLIFQPNWSDFFSWQNDDLGMKAKSSNAAYRNLHKTSAVSSPASDCLGPARDMHRFDTNN